MSFTLKVILFSFAPLLLSCAGETVPDTAEHDSEVGKVLRGNHQLLPIMEYAELSAGYSGKYFLIQSSPGTPTVFTFTFAWRIESGSITYSELPLKSVYVHYDEAVSVPSIRFRWSSGHRVNLGDINSIVRGHVLHAVVTCAHGDWPTALKYATPIYEKHQDP